MELPHEFFSSIVAWRKNETGPVSPTRSLRGGRLLVYFPDLNLCDGAAEAESGGFLDVDNCPPWETWVALFDDSRNDRGYGRRLLSWVAPDFIPYVTAGIHVNPEECVAWLDERDPALRRELEMLP